MDLVELHKLKDDIVELPGVTGLSTEQRKRLTITVELHSISEASFQKQKIDTCLETFIHLYRCINFHCYAFGFSKLNKY